MNNPWNLTRYQTEAMDALCLHRSVKRAALALGMPRKSFDGRLADARKRMGTEFGDRLGYVLDYDRWRRSVEPAISGS